MTNRSKKDAGQGDASKTQEQWVIIADDSSIAEHADSDNENGTFFCKLRHPKSDQGAMFQFGPRNANVYELISFKPKYQSWLIGESVQQNGSLYTSTLVDPVFLILPYLIKAKQADKFMTLDQIVEDEEFSECHRLCSCSNVKELHHVADIKGDEDLKVYRYNEEKTLAWLKAKVGQISQHLEDKQVNVSGGSQVDTFIQSAKCTGVTKESYTRFAHGLVSDYLPVHLGDKLRDHLGIQEIEDKTPVPEPPAKRAKLEKVEALEDYSKENDNTANKPKNEKMSVAQKKLSKVDKSGMKSLASFFSAKTKK